VDEAVGMVTPKAMLMGIGLEVARSSMSCVEGSSRIVGAAAAVAARRTGRKCIMVVEVKR